MLNQSNIFREHEKAKGLEGMKDIGNPGKETILEEKEKGQEREGPTSPIYAIHVPER